MRAIEKKKIERSSGLNYIQLFCSKFSNRLFPNTRWKGKTLFLKGTPFMCVTRYCGWLPRYINPKVKEVNPYHTGNLWLFFVFQWARMRCVTQTERRCVTSRQNVWRTLHLVTLELLMLSGLRVRLKKFYCDGSFFFFKLKNLAIVSQMKLKDSKTSNSFWWQWLSNLKAFPFHSF